MNFLTVSKINNPDWLFLGFFLISVIAIICSAILIKILIIKRKSYKNNFETFGTGKYKYNLWNLIMLVFICFTGTIGALITGGIFFGSI